MKSVLKGIVAVAALAGLAACAGTDNGAANTTARVDTTPPPAMKQDTISFDPVYFDYDKATLRPEGQKVLAGVADWMKKNPNVAIRIAGHADERGTREYNLALGERRAVTSRAYLISLGVPAARLDTVSYGKERPAIVGSSEESYAKNRRAVAELR
jgi:peptidoglycan-associated lipoprotein